MAEVEPGEGGGDRGQPQGTRNTKGARYWKLSIHDLINPSPDFFKNNGLVLSSIPIFHFKPGLAAEIHTQKMFFVCLFFVAL